MLKCYLKYTEVLLRWVKHMSILVLEYVDMVYANACV